MKHSRAWLCIGFSITLALGEGFLAAPAARAYTVCTNGPTNTFAGFYHNTQTRTESFEGASGYIVNRYNSVCDSDTSGPNPSNYSIGSNFTTAWVMIADYSYSSWSQDGVIRGYNTPQYPWAEVVRNEPGWSYIRYDRFTSPLADGTKSAFYEVWSASCGCIQSKIGSTVITNTNFNPFASWSDGGYYPPRWSPEYSGEKMYDSSNILGNNAYHVMFQSIGAQRFVLELEPCTLTEAHTATRSSIAPSGCYDFDVWTNS